MKKIISILLLCFSLFALYSQEANTGYSKIIGISFEISKDSRWGSGEPVVVGIDPGSTAEKAGLNIHDIILEIDGKGTFMRSKGEIEYWFQNSVQDSVLLGIRNFSSSFKEMSIKRHYHRNNIFNEADLATYFSFYSLEDVQEREFILPLTIKSNKDAVYTDYRTFNFLTSTSFTPLDKYIERLIEEHLVAKGLKRDRLNPDILINSYYQYNENSNHLPSSDKFNYEERFDFRIGHMRRLPVIPSLHSKDQPDEDISSFLKFGIQFFANSEGEDAPKIEVWSGEINERFFHDYPFEGYLAIHIPLVLEAFPYLSDVDMTMYIVRKVKYNYTGVSFDMLKPNVIAYIEPGSPADIAGLRKGDIINGISNVPFKANAKKIMQDYHRFIKETEIYRDKNSLYYDCGPKEGERMLWNVADYPKIANIIKLNKYSSVFSYLFNFNRYIDWNTPERIKMDITRRGESFSVDVVPQIMNSARVRVL